MSHMQKNRNFKGPRFCKGGRMKWIIKILFTLLILKLLVVAFIAGSLLTQYHLSVDIQKKKIPVRTVVLQKNVYVPMQPQVHHVPIQVNLPRSQSVVYQESFDREETLEAANNMAARK